MVFTAPDLVRSGTRYRRIAFVIFSLSAATCTLSQTCPLHYRVVDRGPSLVRTLVNTPGLNSHGDLAIWHVVGPGKLQGVVFTQQRTMDIAGEGESSAVYPADISQTETLQTLRDPCGTSSAINRSGDVVGDARTVRSMRRSGERKVHRLGSARAPRKIRGELDNEPHG
jgi:hypothetical protein